MLWSTPCGVTLMNAWRVTPAVRTASLRIDGFASANTAIEASAAIENNRVRMRRLEQLDLVVCFVFIGISYGRGGGVGRGRGVGATLGVAVTVGVEVGVGVGVELAVDIGVAVGVIVGVSAGVGVGVSVAVGLTVGVGVAVALAVDVAVGVGVGVPQGVSVYCWLSLVGLPGPNSPATA